MEALKSFMQNHYSDEKLAGLLAHAQDGKLIYAACCCFVGCATVNHPLRFTDNISLYGEVPEHVYEETVRHLTEARELEGAIEAEATFFSLGWEDSERRSKLIPLILEEMNRREKLRGGPVPVEELVKVY